MTFYYDPTLFLVYVYRHIGSSTSGRAASSMMSAAIMVFDPLRMKNAEEKYIPSSLLMLPATLKKQIQRQICCRCIV
jgi:hypothetical protein